MNDQTLPKEAQALIRVLPMYLAAQAAILLSTSLDIPIYLALYRADHFLEVNGWVGAWFVLVLFGFTNAVFLLLRKSWRLLLGEESLRIKLALGYFLGSLTGMLTLGVRFLPIVPPQYFVLFGTLALLSIAAYLIWKKRVHTPEELFP